MASRIKLKHSDQAGIKPQASDLIQGELAINSADGKLYTLQSDNSTVIDTTKRIFENDTEVIINDDDSNTPATIQANVNGQQKVEIDVNGVKINGPITVSDAETIIFNDQNNDQYIAIKAPDVVDNSYIVKLPKFLPNESSVLSIDREGTSTWINPDVYGGNRIYVSDEFGDDKNDGVSLPVKTLKKGIKLASHLTKKPKNDPGVAYYNAKKLLYDNREYIQKETIAWIDFNFVNFSNNYDIVKCERDIGYWIEAAAYDLVLDTNYNAVTAGLAYTRDNSTYVTGKQSLQTLFSIDYVKGRANTTVSGDATAQARSDAAFDEITDIFSNGASAANALSFTPSVYSTAARVIAKDQLQGNKAFLQAEVLEFINQNYPAVYQNMSDTGTLSKCSRDIGYIVDALSYDIMYGGNSATIRNATSYFVDGVSQLGVGEEIATSAAYTYLGTITPYIIQENTTWTPLQNTVTQVHTAGAGTASDGILSTSLVNIIEDVITAGNTANLPSTTYPDLTSQPLLTYFNILTDSTTIANIKSDTTTEISNNFNLGNFYNQSKCERDVGYIIDAVIFDLIVSGNEKTYEAGESYIGVTPVVGDANQKYATIESLKFARDLAVTIINNDDYGFVYNSDITQVKYVNFPGSAAESDLITLMNDIITIITDEATTNVTLVNGQYTETPVTVKISSGDFYIDNPIIVPDYVSIVGDALRAVVIRPLNANVDMFRVRNGNYIFGLTMRDALDTSNVAVSKFDWGVAFDDPTEVDLDRGGYFGLRNDKPIITLSPYVQNCSIISFLGANGVRVDGSKVLTPNTPIIPQEVETPVVLADGVPEQGRSMVANAFTMVSFGGTGWLVTNEGYAQIVSCFQIFCTNGSYCQSGGYLSITNSATNFGLYALRASGFSLNAFSFDKGYIANIGSLDGVTTVTSVGTLRRPIEQYVLVIKDDNDVDITSQFKSLGSEITFDASTGINVNLNTITTTTPHGLQNIDSIYYDSNSNSVITGLIQGSSYYVAKINDYTFKLTYDEGLVSPVDILAAGTGTHKFILNPEEFVMRSITESHNRYQILTFSQDRSFVEGDVVIGQTGAFTNTAYIANWNSTTRELLLSIELTDTEPVYFTNSSSITTVAGVPATIPAGSFTVSSTSNYFTCVFKIQSTITGSLFQNSSTAIGKKISFHRPSIVNSSAHTWEYAGSGTDYNALPQNGGIGGGESFEQFAELPGQVYSSGTNELGDFKVGTFIVAENKTGNITFTSQVSIGELEVLKLSFSDVEIQAISSDIGLGDNEPGGALDTRIPTQRAVRTFISNRLGYVLDKQVSSNAVPGAVVQLNSLGQINSDLLPASRGVRTYNTTSYGGRLLLSEQIPSIEVFSGDNATESYSQVTLTLTNNITVSAGEIITQDPTGQTAGASGVVKDDVTNSNELVLISPFTGTFNTNNELRIDDSTSLGAANYPTNVSEVTNIVDNYYLKTDTTNQFLLLQTGITYDFTGITTVEGSISGATGNIDSGPIYGIAYSLDTTTLVGGSGYLPSSGDPVTYYDIPVTGGTGTLATVDITVTAGSVTAAQIRDGGTGYVSGDTLSVDATNIGGIGSNFSIDILTVQTRLYISLTGDYQKFQATSTNYDYIEDANANTKNILDLTAYTDITFDAAGTGVIDYVNNSLIIASNGLVNGDPVIYYNGANTSIGGLTSGNTYYVEIDSNDSDIFYLYTNYALTSGSKIDFTGSASGTHVLRTEKVVNEDTDRIFLASHNYTTGQLVRWASASSPSGLTNNFFYYIGSVLTNSFTLHENYADSVASVNGVTINAVNITTTGSGTATITEQNVTVLGNINDSSKISINWGVLAQATIDASNITSGVVTTSRLASTGVANSNTYLRGDSAWATAVENVYVPTNSAVQLIGNYTTNNSIDYYSGSIQIDVLRSDTSDDHPVDGSNYSSEGISSFAKNQFVVTNGKVSTKTSADGGTIDAKTLNGQPSTYYLDFANFNTLTVDNGGTGFTTYTQGDIIYATAITSLAKLPIGSNNTVLTSTGTVPTWSSNLLLSGTLQSNGVATINNTTTSTSTTTGALKVAGGVGIVGAIYAGSIQNTVIGSVAASSGAFTTLTSSNGLTVTDATNATSTTTGSVKLTGGLGVAKDIHANKLYVTTLEASNGVTLVDGTAIDQLKTFDVVMTLSQNWQDTGINHTDLATGSYLMQIVANDSTVGGGHVSMYYTGYISWYSGTTTENDWDEIILNRAGSSASTGVIYCRILRTQGSADNLKLQIAGSTTNTGSSTYTFKFRRLV